MSGASPLAGRGILITRPAKQSIVMADLVRAHGGMPFLFPVIEIRDIEDRTALSRIIDALDDYALALFVSPNAVAKGCEAIRARRALPRQLEVGGVGRATARALLDAGFERVLVPDTGADSESLLELPRLRAVDGDRVVIFRGVGGRELLGATLLERGASVDYAECYRRVKPLADTAPLTHAWNRGEIDAVVATSSEGLRNLHTMLHEHDRERLARTPIFVPHPRIVATASELGLPNTCLTQSGDVAIVAAIARYFIEKC